MQKDELEQVRQLDGQFMQRELERVKDSGQVRQDDELLQVRHEERHPRQLEPVK